MHLPVSPVSYVEAQEGDDGQRLDNFLLRTLGAVPRSLVWNIMRRCPYVVAGLRRAGFQGGWL